MSASYSPILKSHTHEIEPQFHLGSFSKFASSASCSASSYAHEAIVSKITPLIDISCSSTNPGKPLDEVMPDCFIPADPSSKKDAEKSDDFWIQENIIEKIKDYNQGILYQKLISKASSTQIDRVIEHVCYFSSSLRNWLICLLTSMRITLSLPSYQPAACTRKYGSLMLLAMACTACAPTNMASTQSKLFSACLSPYRKKPFSRKTFKESSPPSLLYAIYQNEFGTFIGMKLAQYIVHYEDPIFQEILPNFIMLSQTEKGLNVIKSLIYELKDSQSQSMIVAIIQEKAQSYIENLYSNYAFQLIVKQWPYIVTQPLFTLIFNQVQFYSMQQCSSNVVEAVLYNAPEEYRCKYMDEMILSRDICCTILISYHGE
jgi:hypothetical protein